MAKVHVIGLWQLWSDETEKKLYGSCSKIGARTHSILEKFAFDITLVTWLQIFQKNCHIKKSAVELPTILLKDKL